MPTPSKGEVRFHDGVWQARITLVSSPKKVRLAVRLPGCRTQGEAEERAKLLSDQARRLRKAGHVESKQARDLLAELGAARSKPAVRDALLVIGEMCGVDPTAVRQSSAKTFGDVVKEWTTGEMLKRFPDQMEGASADHLDTAAKRVAKSCFDGIRDVAIDEVTRAHCDEVMRNLPLPPGKTTISASTRKQYAALITKVMGLSELAGYIDRSPLPRGWLPKPPKQKIRYPILYPADDRALLGCLDIPLAWRIYWGFLHREGNRRDEAASMRIREIDFEHGMVALDENKTDHAREWVLSPGVAAALKAWTELRKASPDDLLFVDENGGPLRLDHMADRVRGHLRAAGLTRHDLFSEGPLKRHFDVHCFRRSMVTRNLALKTLTEDELRQRTGHTTAELFRYRQRAAEYLRQNLGDVEPLDLALPDLPKEAPRGALMAPRWPQNSRGGQIRTGDPLTPSFVPGSAEAADSEKPATESHETAPDRTSVGPSLGDDGLSPIAHEDGPDVVEQALAAALERTTDPDAIVALVNELRARREARSKVVSLAAERVRRGR